MPTRLEVGIIPEADYERMESLKEFTGWHGS